MFLQQFRHNILRFHAVTDIFDGYIDGYPIWWCYEVKIRSWTLKIFGICFLSGLLITTRDYVRSTWYYAVNCWAELQDAALSAKTVFCLNSPFALHRFFIHSQQQFKMLHFILKWIFCTPMVFHSFTETVWDARLSGKTDLRHSTAFLFIHRKISRCSTFPYNGSSTPHRFIVHPQQHFKTLRFTLKRLFYIVLLAA